jgi:tetratricopeptide (TPR) repeat protein
MHAESIKYFDKALEIDPTYYNTWASLSSLLQHSSGMQQQSEFPVNAILLYLFFTFSLIVAAYCSSIILLSLHMKLFKLSREIR